MGLNIYTNIMANKHSNTELEPGMIEVPTIEMSVAQHESMESEAPIIISEPNTPAENNNDIKVLEKILNKQFQLVGCKIKVKDIYKMNQEQQTELWNKYTFTKEQFDKWHEFALKTFAKDPLFSQMDEETIESIFDDICNNWSFNIKD